MKKIIIPAIALILASCSTTPNTKWNATIVSKACLNEISKGKTNVSPEQLSIRQEICDCVGQKTIEKYKTEQEAKEKITDVTSISDECQEEWMKKKKESYSK